MKLCSRTMLAYCVCIATLTLSTRATYGQTEACCLTDGACQNLTSANCLALSGTPQGPGSVCAPLEGCCLPDATCIDTNPDCCLAAGGTPCGPGNLCLGDLNMNGIDDACDSLNHPIPAISDYGLVALLLLTAVAGVIVIRRGRKGDVVA